MAASKWRGTVSGKRDQASVEVVTVTAINTPMTLHVTFAVPFDANPSVTVTPFTGNPAAVFASYANVTTAGFDIKLQRSDVVQNTSVAWQALAVTQ